MRKPKITMVACVALLLAFTLATAAVAQQGNRARPGFRAGIAQMIGTGQFIRGLQLTEIQKEEIRAMLQAHKTEILEAREALLRARLALVNEEPNGPAQFGAAQTRMMTLRQEILAQIKTKLTPEQLTMVQKRQQRQTERLQKILNRFESR